jgi:hypothetical protein
MTQTNSLADQVVNQVHQAIGGMYPVSSVGRDEVDAIVRAAVATTLTRITGTGIGVGGARQVDAKLRDLAREVNDGSTPKPRVSYVDQYFAAPKPAPVPHYSYTRVSAGSYQIWQHLGSETRAVGTVERTTEQHHNREGVPRGHKWIATGEAQGVTATGTGPNLDKTVSAWCRYLRNTKAA